MNYCEFVDILYPSNELIHYGIKQTADGKGSGRYRKGTGKRPNQHDSKQNSNTSGLGLYLLSLGVDAAVNSAIKQAKLKAYDNKYHPKDEDERIKVIKASKQLARSEKRGTDAVPDKKTGLYKLKNGPESVEEASAHTNPYMNEIGGKSNCMSCALTYDLRRRGYDVVANPMNKGVSYPTEYKKIIKNFDDISGWISLEKVRRNLNPYAIRSTKVDALRDILLEKSKSPKGGSRGTVCIDWRRGGSHIFNYEIVDGKVKFIDGQTGGEYKNFDKYFLNEEVGDLIGYSHLDRAEYDWKKLRELVDAD